MNLFHWPKTVIYVYVQNAAGDFWTYDGIRYHRFVWREGEIFYVRAQKYLPPAVYGTCLQLSLAERLCLVRAASAGGCRLAFFANIESCVRHALSLRHAQYVFDAHLPAGRLEWIDGVGHPRLENE